ncbi:MAG: MoxR family ATPase [Solobacterium sp.]|nr:MoxR family ATPase [Solobacterium sp.]
MKNGLNEKEVGTALELINRLSDYYDVHVIGQTRLKFTLIAGLMADGHILIESVPGLAKTTAAKAIATAVDGSFSRIQCTPDLMPADIIGTQVYHQGTGKFETILGPIFANFVLLDEINRSSARTQSAMLEAMQEKAVTIAGVTYPMPADQFTVIATQNPYEQEGTYPLAEAQKDRFMLMAKLDYPSAEEEKRILELKEKEDGRYRAVMTIEDLKTLRAITEKVYMDDAVRTYIVRLCAETRKPEYENIRLGVSPRASIAFLKAGKAAALYDGRDYVIPEDIKMLAKPVMAHRLSLSYSARANAVTADMVIDDILRKVPTP